MIGVYDLKKDKIISRFFSEYNYYYNPIYLYNECLYIFRSELFVVKIINFNNIKEKKYIPLSRENLRSVIFHRSSLFVDEVYFYIKFYKYINLFDHTGEFFREIKIDKSNLNESLCVDSKYIYLVQEFQEKINLLIFRHEIKYNYKYKKSKKNHQIKINVLFFNYSEYRKYIIISQFHNFHYYYIQTNTTLSNYN